MLRHGALRIIIGQCGGHVVGRYTGREAARISISLGCAARRSVWHAGRDAEAEAQKLAAEIARVDANLWQARFDDTPPEQLQVATAQLQELKARYLEVTGEPFDDDPEPG